MTNQIQKNIDSENFLKLATLARLEVYEPFEGELNLERLQKARVALEKGLKKITSRASQWIESTGVVDKTKGHLANFRTSIIKNKDNPDSKIGKIANFTGKFAKKINHQTGELQDISKDKLRNLQSKVWERSRVYILKGFDLLWRENPENWILPKASKALGRKLQNLEELQFISNTERGELLEQLYPYNSERFQKMAKGFEISINVSLGLVVATNMPGTGLLVSGINTIKTIVKIASGLQVLAALYGYKIKNKHALFRLCGQIIASMEDFESRKDHKPLSFTELTPLFSESNQLNQKSFEGLIAQALKKEAYIAIPGVGMLSLGKIQLDDYKAEKIALSLMEKRRMYLELSGNIESSLLESNFTILKSIFRQLYALDALLKLKLLVNSGNVKIQVNSWIQKLPFKKPADVFPVLDKLAVLFYFKQQYTIENYESKPITADLLDEVFRQLGSDDY